MKLLNRKLKDLLKLSKCSQSALPALILISVQVEAHNAASVNNNKTIASAKSTSTQKIKRAKRKTMDYIVVFKKETSPETAELIMKKSGYVYKAGIDSSRGKLYFYNTGPKFILQTEEKNFAAVKKYFSEFSEIHEVYTADWKIKKD